MLRIGLTGGIGAGKSAVAARLAEHGALVVDSDVIAREVVQPGTPGLAAVVAEFGDQVLTADGALDRSALGELVFADDDRRARLGAILHPLISARSAELVRAADDDVVVVHDIPLLAENNMAPGFPLVVVVQAEEQARLQRLVTDRGMPADQAWSRIRAQAGDADRAAIADVLLHNDSSLKDLLSRVDSLYEDRLVPFRDNLSAGRAATTDGVRLHPYDSTWPQTFERIAARLRAAGGDRVERLDHIGSTAVPGLLAKDVIDVMLTVPDLATADVLRPALEQAGYPCLTHITADAPRPPQADPARWGKRMHGSADPGRLTNVHLRVGGSPGWTFALAFRDWLRADEAARRAYGTEKQRLAARHADSREDYAVAKEPWFDHAWPQLQDWIARTGWRPPPA